MPVAFFFWTERLHFGSLPGCLLPGFIALCACNAHLTPFGLQWRSGAMNILVRAAAPPGLHCARAMNAARVFFFKSDFISFDLRGNLFTGFIALCACNAHLTPFGLQWRSCAMSILARAATAPGLHCARAVNAAAVAHGGHYPVFPTPITRPRPELKWQHEMWAFQRPVSRQATPSRQKAAALMPPGSLGPTPPASRRGRSVSSWGAAEPKGASL